MWAAGHQIPRRTGARIAPRLMGGKELLMVDACGRGAAWEREAPCDEEIWTRGDADR